jgi:rifampicin phosphotransferase
LPEGFRREETVLVARSIDAGWMATMALVAGVAVETGGDLSHGSILLREIGLPAVTNLTGVTRVVRTGQRVRLKASYGVLEADESNA